MELQAICGLFYCFLLPTALLAGKVTCLQLISYILHHLQHWQQVADDVLRIRFRLEFIQNHRWAKFIYKPH